MILLLLFIVVLVGFVAVVLLSRNTYDDLIEPLDEKEYKMKKLMPAALYIMDNSPIQRFSHKRDQVVRLQLVELHGAKYADYYFRLHWANKLSLILLLALVFTFFSAIIGLQGSENPDIVTISQSGEIDRPSFESESKETQVVARVKSGEQEEELQYELTIPKQIPNDVDAVGHVKEQINSDIEEYSEIYTNGVKNSVGLVGIGEGFGVYVSFKSSKPDVITQAGEIIRPANGAGNQTVELVAVIGKGDVVEETEPFTVLVLEESIAEMAKRLLDEMITGINSGKSDKILDNTIVLPANLAGNNEFDVSWSTVNQDTEKSNDGIMILLFGLVILVLVFFLVDKELKDQIEKRHMMIRLDFPDFLNKLTLLINAGMTTSRAWEKIVVDYQYMLNGQRYLAPRPLYEELATTLSEIRGGKSEAQAYEDFAQRCKVPEVIKFISVILQNLRKGNTELAMILRLQGTEVWEMRKQVSKKLGEEAGTKLLFPMMIMLCAILIIVIGPAIFSMSM